MKIQTERQQPAVEQQAAGKTRTSAREKAPAKGPRKGDTVELSASLDADLKARQAQQSKRVEAIKAMVRGGDYQIDSTEVAKKILSRTSGR